MKFNLQNEKIDTFLIPKYKIKILKNKMLAGSRAFFYIIKETFRLTFLI